MTVGRLMHWLSIWSSWLRTKLYSGIVSYFYLVADEVIEFHCRWLRFGLGLICTVSISNPQTLNTVGLLWYPFASHRCHSLLSGLLCKLLARAWFGLITNQTSYALVVKCWLIRSPTWTRFAAMSIKSGWRLIWWHNAPIEHFQTATPTLRLLCPTSFDINQTTIYFVWSTRLYHTIKVCQVTIRLIAHKFEFYHFISLFCVQTYRDTIGFEDCPLLFVTLRAGKLLNFEIFPVLIMEASTQLTITNPRFYLEVISRPRIVSN